MPSLSRRHCLQKLGLIAFGSLGSGQGWAAEGPNSTEKQTVGEMVEEFLEKYQVPGLSVAFAKAGEMAYVAGFGFANEPAGERVNIRHRFRIASVSKPLTSVGIYWLIEQGELKLTDKVFGSVLEFDLSRVASAEVAAITVHQLLTHTGGGWGKNGDPMFQRSELNHAELIEWTLATHALESAPGEHYSYSNFGYCVLGRVIEKISGQPYRRFMQERVLEPCGIEKMQIAGNSRAELAPGEVVYAGQNGQDPYRMNVRRMDSHGGWLATPTDLVRFLTRIDAGGPPADLLRATTIKTMTTGTAANANYASGFSVNRAGNWWHGGSLPGTTTIVVRTASGLCWAGFANTRTDGIDLALDQLMWRIARAVPSWRA